MMITIHSNFICLLLCLLYFVCSVLLFPVETNPIKQLLLLRKNKTMVAGTKDSLKENSMRSPNTRAKRSSFKEAGETSQLKFIQTFAQLFRNYGAEKPLGGRHPFDPTVPLLFCKIVRTKLFSMLDS